MTDNLPKPTLPEPRPTVGDPSLTRPDWTVSARNTEGVLALDKNEVTDDALRKVIVGVLKSVPGEAVFEYPECAPYYHLLAGHLGLSAGNLLFTAGADGAIRMVFEAFISPEDTVLLTAPTFAMFPIYARMYTGRVVELAYEPSDAGPVLTAEKVCHALETHRPKLFCLSNPDSPTGTIFKMDDLIRIIQSAACAGTVILVDEVYYPFSGLTVLDRIDGFPNLVVTQTFAKAWGLAGLRLGFAAAHPDMTAILHKVRPMYEVNGFALAVWKEMLAHHDAVLASVARINDGKVAFLERMKGHGLRTLDCAGNFLHVDFGDNRDGVHAALDGKVLYKKSFPEACLAGYSRFSAAPEPVMEELAALIEGAL